MKIPDWHTPLRIPRYTVDVIVEAIKVNGTRKFKCKFVMVPEQ